MAYKYPTIKRIIMCILPGIILGCIAFNIWAPVVFNLNQTTGAIYATLSAASLATLTVYLKYKLTEAFEMFKQVSETLEITSRQLRATIKEKEELRSQFIAEIDRLSGTKDQDMLE